MVAVELKWSDGHAKTVEAVPVGEWFAVHAEWRDDAPRAAGERAWQAVHVGTGTCFPGRFWTQAGATAWAEGVAGLADWSSTDLEEIRRVASGVAEPAVAAGESAREIDRAAYFTSPRPAWPTDAADATADRMARYYAVHAMFASQRALAAHGLIAMDRGMPTAVDSARASSAFVDAWAVARLLRALQEHAPAAADAVAADMWEALESGDTLHENAWEWLAEYRIDPDAVARDFREAEVKRRAASAATTAQPDGTPSP
jgi:hypothetical protein